MQLFAVEGKKIKANPPQKKSVFAHPQINTRAAQQGDTKHGCFEV